MKTVKKILKWTGISLGGLLLLIIVALVGITLYLTPERLQSIIHEEADAYLEADVQVDNPQFSIWSSFPHFRISTDSIRIVSKTLKGVNPKIRASLPTDCDSLASLASFRGGIDIVAAIFGKYRLHDVDIRGLNLNLVAVNDSLNNYNIIPSELSSSPEVPFVSADVIRISAPGKLSFFSLATSTKATANLNETTLIRTDSHKNEYELSIPGNISLNVNNLKILRNFPFIFDGRMRLGFNPFSLALYDYSINLGNTRGKLNLDMKMGETVQINKFSFRLEPFNVPQLLSYFPDFKIAGLEQFATNLEVDASAKLIGKYRLSSETLPSMRVDFNIPSGNIMLALNNGESLPLYHSNLHASLNFNGVNPSLSTLSIDPALLSIPGAEVNLSARISDLMTTPHILTDIDGSASLSAALQQFLKGSTATIAGNIDFKSSLSLSIPELSFQALSKGVQNVNLSGKLDIKDFKCRLPLKGINIASGNSKLNLSSSCKNISFSNFTQSLCNAPASIDFKADNFLLSDIPDSLKLAASGLNISSEASLPSFSSILKSIKGNLSIFARNLKLESPDANMHLNGVKLTLATPKNNPGSQSTASLPVRNTVLTDKSLENIPHTPQYLIPNLSQKFRNLYNSLSFNLGMNVNNGVIRAKAFPVNNYISNLNLSLNPDSISLRNLDLTSQKNHIRMSASAGNLRKFLTLSSPGTPQILPISLKVALDTVNINKLARAYESGVALKKGVKATFNDKPLPLDAMDTTALLIPKNIRASIDASIMETVYMNLHLFDLATKVNIADGVANFNDLTISSDFGKARLNLGYDTGDIQNMGINTNISVYDINIVNFFKNFHTLLLMMPQMKNLSGILTADVEGGMKIFPKMYANVPSLNAKINLQGHDLTVHQNKFIHHIAKMMMIETYNDIRIQDLNVNASVHDNLIELYPFNFDFDRYKLQMVGTNNFNGKLYYHLAVLKSPVPIPFAINITGFFHDPKLHFGGPTFKINKGEEVTSSIMESNTFNIVREAKTYIREFIQKAAESDSSDNSEYAYPVPDYRKARNLNAKSKSISKK